MTQQQSPEDNARAPIDRTGTSRGGGSIGLVLLIALVLIGAAGGLLFIGRAKAEPYILALLAVLAMVGVFLLFALAAGILRTSGREAASPLLKSVVDGANEGILVTDASGRVLYANAAYLRLVEAPGAHDIRPVERVFIGDPGVSEAVYRLLKAAREGRRGQEEVRIGAHNGEAARWLRIRVRPARRRQARSPHDRLGPGRRDPRARAARERVSGTAARDRLSRSCPGRILFRRGQRQHRLSQRHARQLARP
jgi:two-component system cell cycle sensor histidine kinase/response regulator CckA